MTGWSDLRFNVARFRTGRVSGPGAPTETVVEFDVEVPASGLAVTTSRVPDGAPIAVSGELAAGISEFDLRAHVATRWEADCRRCLEPVGGDLIFDVATTFVENDLGEEADVYPIEGDWIDVGAVVREEILLGLPLTPLCSDDCVGSDPERFPTGATDNEASAGEIDPRWAALSELTFDDDREGERKGGAPPDREG